MADTTNVVKPTEFAKELGVAPQLVFSWIRSGSLKAEKCQCGHFVLLRDVADEYAEARAAKQAEKEARIAAELEADAEADQVVNA